MRSRNTIRIRVTDEDLEHLDEVRAYVERHTETMFGKPAVSDETAVLHLMRFGWDRAKARLRRDTRAAAGAGNDDPPGADDPQTLGREDRLGAEAERFRQSAGLAGSV